ncbi:MULTISPECIES: GDSL-type esterase/lipase family protein [Streptomyces]|uniref:SGNH hydrolase-type esterase domain-containing protein n=3 Tax=Streptomyces TaxID=1883 RepID=A0AAP6EEW9_9ACTN|nr:MULTISPECIES: GDSL-type esterase/lipase family protein [Streptomyces]MBP5860607.1 hypothetical protein [Streptomyces sp. LBUM 1484]MBP5870407.1 hypothetical protein [Streptomyces sp. LBUM 1485]MBP5879145.1 hypothetical protein [Streptomyces sp. LBUM 1477]MBP5886832.1 hypothetical protein [Streptomyces sp. LBUM 1487]MBP5890433.1 hypothetical protein [Streptomyces sp. LBUM 1481]MBP5902830.1 hypothetical protein [Streptomyces sp. LBUM 1488]MBP5909053.1 hypothetical protein [Streptomyces sp. 
MTPDVPPRRLPGARAELRRGRELNAAAHRITDQDDARYVDLWPVLAAHRGGLRSQYTHDDLHLNGPGYRTWAPDPAVAPCGRRA